MASTYTSALGFELQANGENSTTWGTKTNNNLSLVEEAVAGVIAVAMADADVTLTSTSAVSNQARNAVLIATGANTATRDLIAPAVEKKYVVRNATTGGQSVRIRTSSGVAVTISNGATVSVFCDGADFYAVNSTGNTALDLIATVTPAADKYLYFTSSSAIALGTATTFGRSLMDDADAATARTTLGLGTAATQASTAFQTASANLTTFAGIAPSANIQSLLAAADYAAAKTLLSLNNVENKSSATIRGELTAANVNTALALTAARVASGSSTNSGKISWGTAAPGTLDEGEIYLRYT